MNTTDSNSSQEVKDDNEHRSQPTRLSRKRIGRRRRVDHLACMASLAMKTTMSDLLKGHVCMSVSKQADVFITPVMRYKDIEIRERVLARNILIDQLTIQTLEANYEANYNVKTASIDKAKVSLKTNLQQQADFKLFAKLLGPRYYVVLQPYTRDLFRRETSLFCPVHVTEWRVITVGFPGHIAVALLNLRHKIVEYFDSSGKRQSGKKGRRVLATLDNLVEPGTRIVIVNEQNLQQEDHNCQTWIWYYVFHRVVQRESAPFIVKRLQSMTPMERFYEIQRFWDYLLQTQNSEAHLQQERRRLFLDEEGKT